MFIIILLAILALTGIVLTAIEVRRDGYHAATTDWTRVAEYDAPESAAGYR
ncbi:MAG: hypothetical protein ACTH8F_04455 [Microbacterium sp.]|uniref:hypothetical protein n=1 Tax=Microbacterium sp. TaxID=51671 RepID=UPI003F9679BB